VVGNRNRAIVLIANRIEAQHGFVPGRLVDAQVGDRFEQQLDTVSFEIVFGHASQKAVKTLLNDILGLRSVRDE